jgi:hypothetical protein
MRVKQREYYSNKDAPAITFGDIIEVDCNLYGLRNNDGTGKILEAEVIGRYGMQWIVSFDECVFEDNKVLVITSSMIVKPESLEWEKD